MPCSAAKVSVRLVAAVPHVADDVLGIGILGRQQIARRYIMPLGPERRRHRIFAITRTLLKLSLGHRENASFTSKRRIIVDYQIAPPAAWRGLSAKVIADG